MASSQLTFVARFAVPPETLFDVLADHAGMSEWSGANVSVLGGPGDGGVGTLRRIRVPGLAIDEEVTWFDRPHRMVYRIVRGLPVRHHRGEILVEPWEDGSQLTWDIVADFGVPGLASLFRAVLRPAMNRALAKLSERLA